MSTFDLVFSFNINKGSKSGNSIEQIAEIVMSPQHAKAFAMTLSDTVRNYEKLFGTINVQPDPEVAKELQSSK